MNSDNLQLYFIETILHCSEMSITSSTHFKSSLVALSQLLSTDEVVFSTIYPDEKNHIFHLNSYFHSTSQIDSEAIKHSCNQISSTDILSTLKNETSVDYQQLIQCLTGDKTSKKINADDYFYVVPFLLDKKLIGIIGYRSKKLIDIKSTYASSYHALKSVFIRAFESEDSFITKNTYQTVLDLMPQRVFWKNQKSVYMGCNKAFSQDASLQSPDEIIGLTDHDIFPEQADLYRSDDANAMDTRKHLIGFEEPQTHSDGKTLWLRTSKRPIINNNNNVVGLVGTYDDISELKKTQNELSLSNLYLERRVEERTKALTISNERLEEVIKKLKSTQDHLVETEKMAALGSLVAGVSHEINTPIGVAVTGASHLESTSVILKNNVLTGKVSKTEFISSCDALINSSNLILRNLSRAADLVESFKMIAVDQSSDEIRPIVLKKYLLDIVSAMSTQAKKQNVKITIIGDENLSIVTCPGAIAQISTNLITNSMQHAIYEQSCLEIEIQFHVIKEQLKLTYKDNGIGISKDTLPKIFQPFYTTNRVLGGSGLGLSIVFNLVTQRLNGTITCDSELKEWTRFNISFPI